METRAKLSGWTGRRVAITGGAGFIGSNLAIRLSEAGASVHVLDTFDGRGGANEANLAGRESNIRIERGDMRDSETARNLVKSCDVLFALAAQTSHQDSMTDPLYDLDVNTRAQVQILEACRELAPQIRIVFGSTRQLYGKAQYLPVDEKHPVNPPDVNAINKIAGEHYYMLYSRLYGLKANIARLTNIYGPRMRIRDAKQMFLGAWLGAAIQDKTFEVWGGRQRRDLCYVDDAVDALISMADAEPHGQIFNVGGGPPISLDDLAEKVVTACGTGRFEKKEFPEERRRIDIGDFFADDTLLQKTTGWKSRVSLSDGLSAAIGYYRGRLGQYI